MSPAWNPLHGAMPTTQYAGGAMPSGADTSAGKGILGTPAANITVAGTPMTLGLMVILAAGVIVAIHVLGIRTHFTVSAG